MKPIFRQITSFLFIFALASCSQYTPPVGVKLGKPYEVNGQTYYPEVNETYDETGLGSWYGPGFHGKRTASGERFNENDITAAHPTLPMPSLVRITNIQNGESIIARINDRGPFHSNRIIDLSRKTAQLIGLKSTQTVRVQYLKKETDDFMTAFRAGQMDKLDMAEINRKDQEEPETQTAINETAQEQASSEFNSEEVNMEAVASSPVQEIETADLAAPNASTNEQNIMPLKPVENSPRNYTNVKYTPGNSTNSVANVLKLPEKSTTVTPSKESTNKANNNKYVVLAGSFSVEDNAKKLAKKVASAGKVAIAKIATKGKNMWRVEVGGFNDKTGAQKALATIHKLGISDAKMISK